MEIFNLVSVGGNSWRANVHPALIDHYQNQSRPSRNSSSTTTADAAASRGVVREAASGLFPPHRSPPLSTPPSSSDPRVFFAAERTLLAWVRTSLAVMGFGFVVARFGLYMRVLAGEKVTEAQRITTTTIGVGLVVLGVVALLFSAVQHVRYVRTLPRHDRPRVHWLDFAFFFSLALAMLGTALAVYLVVSLK